MTNVGFPILIYGAYMATNREYRALQKLTPEIAAAYPAKEIANRTPIYHDILFSNITATAQSEHRAGLIWGLPEAPASNVVLQQVNITADKPFGIYNAQGVRLVNCRITTPDGVNKLSCTNAEVTISSQ
jgi:polygalacturonase